MAARHSAGEEARATVDVVNDVLRVGLEVAATSRPTVTIVDNIDCGTIFLAGVVPNGHAHLFRDGRWPRPVIAHIPAGRLPWPKQPCGFDPIC